jgi:hypothetical protein
MHACERIPVGDGLARWLALLVMLLLWAPAGTHAATFRELVEHPSAPVFGLHDSAGHTMDTLKVIDSGQLPPYDRYVGVYHFRSGLTYITAVATSNDLVTWTYRANLAVDATQPAITRLGTGTRATYWAAWEVGCSRGSCLEVRYYPSFNALTTGSARLQHVIGRKMPGNCNEGTPNFFSTPTRAKLDIGFHYNSTCHTGTDREARGKLTGLGSSWTWAARPNPRIDRLLTNAGAPGNHGDRDRTVFKGKAYRVYEAQLRPAVFQSFRPFLFDGHTITRLNVDTSCGATALANTSLSNVTLPTGAPGVFVAHFIFGGGAGTCGSGEMTYFAPAR